MHSDRNLLRTCMYVCMYMRQCVENVVERIVCVLLTSQSRPNVLVDCSVGSNAPVIAWSRGEKATRELYILWQDFVCLFD